MKVKELKWNKDASYGYRANISCYIYYSISFNTFYNKWECSLQESEEEFFDEANSYKEGKALCQKHHEKMVIKYIKRFTTND